MKKRTGLMIATCLLLGACTISVPSRPVTLPRPTSAEGLACWRQCTTPTASCEAVCRNRRASLLTVISVKNQVASCVATCDDQRDDCLSTCPQ